LLFRNPDTSLVCLQVGFSFGVYYFFIALLPTTFGSLYNFSQGQIGLTSIAGGIGSCLGTLTAGRISDRYCAKISEKNGGKPAKEARLRLCFYVLPCLLIGTIMYGWFLSARLHWIAPLIAFAISKYQ
jgi:MFS family permease